MKDSDILKALRGIAEEAIKIFNKRTTIYVVERPYIKYTLGRILYFAKKELAGNIDDVLRVIERTYAFTRAVKAIIERYESLDETKVRVWLRQFTEKILMAYAEQKAIDVDEYITMFINDLNMMSQKAPPEWSVKAWVRGVIMEVDKVNIALDGIDVILRSPEPDDLEFEYPVGVIPPIDPLELFSTTSILEVKGRGRIEEVNRDIVPLPPDDVLNKIEILLRLYKIGSVYIVRKRYEPKSIIILRREAYPRCIYQLHYRYVISGEDARMLPDFIKHFIHSLPTDESGKLLMSDYLGIAISRYQDALLKPEPIENRIGYAVMGLEALLLKGGELMELSHKLGQRVAILMRICGKSPKNVYEDVKKKAYIIRSRFVHGAPPPEKLTKEAPELLNKVLSYLRTSIIMFLQIKNEVEKEDFIEKIDDALLSSEDFEYLRTMMETASKYIAKPQSGSETLA